MSRAFLILFLFCAGPLAVAADESHEGETHHRFAIALFVGATRVHGDNEMTFGIEAGYHINDNWSIGGVVERAEREQHSTLVLLGLGWHPAEQWRIQLGFGRKDPSGERENVIRVGFGYEMLFDENWFIKPYLAADFIENESNEQVLGIYFGRGF